MFSTVKLRKSAKKVEDLQLPERGRGGNEEMPGGIS